MTDLHARTLVLGAGPGGYAAAFRAADLGDHPVVLVERWPTLGGVCLNVGCIPSKALLHIAHCAEENHALLASGVFTGTAPDLQAEGMRTYKNQVIQKLTSGLSAMAKQRKVQVLQGVAVFEDSHRVVVTAADGGTQSVRFDQCIIAVGSESVWPSFIPKGDPRIFDSTGALELTFPKGRLLILGGGIIGLEMASVYHALGADIHVVELGDRLIPAADDALMKPFFARIQKKYGSIRLQTELVGVEPKSDGLWVRLKHGGQESAAERFDQMLVAVGRKPNGNTIAAERAGIYVDAKGFIPTDTQMRTNIPHIFAIGDVTSNPMLAHKATHEGHLAAEVASGKPYHFDGRMIPSVAYTDPEIAWVGLTEREAKDQGREVEVAAFPWAASGRALSMGRSEGLTRLIFDAQTHRLVGAGIVGSHAGDLISEACLAIEMGCDAEDIGLTIHPHPTLSETVALAAEMHTGSITDLIAPKKKGAAKT